MSTITYAVTIVSSKFLLDGSGPTTKLTFRDGDTYIFDQAHSSNSGHILQFSATSDNSGSSEYTTGVTKAGTPGSSGASTTIVTSSSTTDTIYYYSSGGSGYGSEFSNSGFVTSTDYNLMKPKVGATSSLEKWGPMWNHSVDQIDQAIKAGVVASIVDNGNATAITIGTDESVSFTGAYVKLPVHANDAARNTAIASPANGMIIYNTGASALQQYTGSWSTISPAPNVTSISGFLNEDTDSTLTIFGSSFSSASVVKMFGASAGGSQVGTDATTTFNSSTKLTAVFGAGSLGSAGDTVYIEVDNAGVTNRFATAITLNADPTATFAGGTGTGFSSPTHLGTYAGVETEVDSDTKLLLNFDRGGGTDIEDNSNFGDDGHKVTASNNAIIKSSPFGDGKTAIKFDGTGDYLRLADHADWNLGDTFTIEMWLWMNPAITAAQTIWTQQVDGNTRFVWWINGTTRKVTMNLNGVNMLHNDLSKIDSFYSWHHVALVMDGTSSYFYSDGQLKAKETIVVSGGIADYAQPLYIGFQKEDTPFQGYMDEIRVVKGVAVYTGEFTPSTTRLATTQSAGTNIAAITGTATKLLIHSNLSATSTTITDSSASSHTITKFGDIKHSTLYNVAESTVTPPALAWPASGKAFGSYGAYFDGATDYITIASSPVLGTAVFTIDFWLNVAATQNAGETTYYIWEGRTDSATDNTISITMNASDQLQINNFRSDKTTAMIPYHADTVSTADTWKHIAVVRESANVIKLYIGGVLKGTSADSDQGSFDNDGTSLLGIEWQVSANEFTGYIDVFRISNTARWTANFTPPTKLYMGVAGTATVPTITFTGTATPALASNEDIEFTSVDNTAKADGSRSLTDTDIGLTLTNTADSNLATLAGTLTSAASTTHTNMPLKIQVRKTLATAAYANASRTVTFSGSETTIGLAPAMPVSGTGIPASTTITTVDSSTTITLSANPTGGTLTGQSLIFEDLTRITHLGGSDTLDNTDTMLTIAAGASIGPTLFNARRYVGTSVARSLTGFGFAPDLVWIKARSVNKYHMIFDTVRGATKAIHSNNVDIENTRSASDQGGVLGFDANGFNTTADTANQGVNYTGITHVAWGWKAGGEPSGELVGTGATMSGTSGAGSIHDSATGVSNLTSLTQSVSQTSGFSITKFTGHNDGGTFPHDLGGTPAFIIVKSSSHAYSWHVWHQNLTSTTNNFLLLDTNAAEGTESEVFSTAHSSTLIYTGGSGYTGGSAGVTYICYAWKAVAGVSAFGSFTGNTSAHNVTTGFSPKFLLLKNITSPGGQNWMIWDTFRGGDTNWDSPLNANDSGPETDETASVNRCRLGKDQSGSALSGFSFPASNHNQAGGNASHTYIYAAFA